MPREIPTYRLARTSTLGRFAAGQAVHHVGTKASTMGRSEQASARVLEQRALDMAD
jgi:hypothetical protein